MSQFLVATPVPAAAVVVVSFVVSSVRDPFPFVVAVAVLVAGVFLDVVIIVPDVVSVSGLSVAVSWAIAVLVPIVLFHIDAVLSLFPFLCKSPARLLRISFVCCYCGPMLSLSLSLLPACVVFLFPKLVL